MYIRGEIILAVYVDDILIAGPSVEACNSLVAELSRKVEVVNKGEVRSFLGFNVVRNTLNTRYLLVTLAISIDYLQNTT
jgi:hypothetical protein